MRDFLRQSTPVVLVAAVLTALAWWPAQAWGGDEGIRALLYGAGICVIAALLAQLAMALIRRSDTSPEGTSRALQVGIGVRLIATLALTLPVVVGKWVPPFQLAAWLGLHYVGQLVLEVFVSLKALGQNHGPSGSTERGTEPSAGDESPARSESTRHTTTGDESE